MSRGVSGRFPGSCVLVGEGLARWGGQAEPRAAQARTPGTATSRRASFGIVTSRRASLGGATSRPDTRRYDQQASITWHCAHGGGGVRAACIVGFQGHLPTCAGG